LAIYVFSASYNSNVFAKACIESVANQTLKVKKHYYIDDGSTDNTRDELQAYLNNLPPHLTIRLNDERNYKLKNLYEFVQGLASDDIVCVLDGDDWLASPDVIAKVRDVYSDPRVDYVYTNWKYSHDESLGISEYIPDANWDPYSGKWITSALSTFRVRAFKSVPVENFFRWDEKWFTMACDQAYVLPILWQLRERDGDYRAVRFIDEPLYVYQFLQNPSKLRHGEENIERAGDAARSAKFLRDRGFINGIKA
jgi:glycosyltransferase involved in cell wall biosynthesis